MRQKDYSTWEKKADAIQHEAEIDEALEESFPASDPLSWTLSHESSERKFQSES